MPLNYTGYHLNEPLFCIAGISFSILPYNGSSRKCYISSLLQKLLHLYAFSFHNFLIINFCFLSTTFYSLAPSRSIHSEIFPILKRQNPKTNQTENSQLFQRLFFFFFFNVTFQTLEKSAWLSLSCSFNSLLLLNTLTQYNLSFTIPLPKLIQCSQ